MSEPDLREGLVVRVDRKQCHVEVDGEALPCSLRGRFFEDRGVESRPVAVGDRVRVRLPAHGQGAVEEILPRRTRIARCVPRSRGRVQVLAANVDLLVIVVTLREPPLRPGLVDRLLVVAEKEGLQPVVVLNKVDLCSAREADQAGAVWRDLGYPVLATSATESRGLIALEEQLGQQIALFVGHSGVGKTSLLNALDPTLELRVGALTRGRGRGSHTTVAHSLLRLGSGARVVDGPGFREFGLEDLDPQDLGHFFPDLRALLPRCRYPGCSHTHEPDCAVKEALEKGTVTPERYRVYLKLRDELRGGGERMPRSDAF